MSLLDEAESLGEMLLVFARTRALNEIIFVPVLTGILLTNINMASSRLPIIFALITIISWVIIDNKEKYLPLVRE